jgi:hypothetical protein
MAAASPESAFGNYVSYYSTNLHILNQSQSPPPTEKFIGLLVSVLCYLDTVLDQNMAEYEACARGSLRIKGDCGIKK